MSIPPTALPHPSSDDVAALLRARTKDLDGKELGVFSGNTRPTDTEVDRLITMAYAEVTGQTGVNLGDRCAPSAQALITIRAAMWVELSYFPEQVRSDRSVYIELADQWTAGMPSLMDCVAGNIAPDGSGGAAGLRFGSLPISGWTATPPLEL